MVGLDEVFFSLDLDILSWIPLGFELLPVVRLALFEFRVSDSFSVRLTEFSCIK